MDRSSNSVKIEKIRRALETKNYDTALAIAKTVDSARIKSAADLSVVAEAYDKNGIYDTALVYYEQIYLRSKTRRILIHLINLCLKQSMADMAELYLRDFTEMAPRDFYRYIFRYHIDKLRGEDLEVLIYDLEQLKAENFMEDWAYELAKLYHKSGQSEKCISECNDIILWFGNGMYVDRARGLRAIHLSRLGRSMGSAEAGIAKEVYRLMQEGKSEQDLENFIEEATMPEGNVHYSEEEYNQERFGKPVYDEEGKDVIWNTREFGAITDEMIQQQNTMDLLKGMQVAQQLRMQLGAGQEMEIEKPGEDVLPEEEPGGESGKTSGEEWESFAPPQEKTEYSIEAARMEEARLKEEEAERIRQAERQAREREAEQELYRLIEQNQSEEELSKTIRKLTAGGEPSAQEDAAGNKQATKKLHFWGRGAHRKESKAADIPETGQEQDLQENVPAVPEEVPKVQEAPKDVKPEESPFEAFRTGAKILTARVGAPSFGQDTGKFGQDAGKAEGQEKTQAPVEKTRPEPPQEFVEWGKTAEDEEPLPEIAEIDFAEQEAVPEENSGQTEPELEPEPEPLYEYPEEILADYAKEAPTLDARLKNQGMKPEEFFGGFLVSADVRRQIFRCMEQILTGRSRAINIILTGEEKRGKTTLAKAIAKCTQVLGGMQSARVALIRGDKLNRINLEAKKEQLRGSTMLVEKASLMTTKKVEELLDLNGELAGEIAVILEDERSHMNVFLRKNEELVRVYNHRIDLPERDSADLFLQALSMLYRNEYTMTESVAAEFLGAVRDCIQENPQNAYDAVCGYTEGVLKRAEKRMAQMLRGFALDGKYKQEELTMLRAEDL